MTAQRIRPAKLAVAHGPTPTEVTADANKSAPNNSPILAEATAANGRIQTSMTIFKGSALTGAAEQSGMIPAEVARSRWPHSDKGHHARSTNPHRRIPTSMTL